MKKFFREEKGETTVGKIILFAIAAIIILLIFRLTLYVQCVSDTALGKFQVSIMELLHVNPPQSCTDTASGTASGGQNGTSSDGSSSNGTTDSSSGGSTSGSSTVDGSGPGNGPSSTAGYVPVSYYDNTGVSLSCQDNQSYYQFTIPIDTPPQGNGTQTLTVTNRKGWDMWIQIVKVDSANGLVIGTYPTQYQSFPNGQQVSFKIPWTWNVANNYNGARGSATVYFKTVCTKPAANQIYIPIPDTPTGFQAVNITDTGATFIWNKVNIANQYNVIDDSYKIQGFVSTTTYTATNLLPGTKYVVHLAAKNGSGISPNTTITFTTTGENPMPGIPQNFKVINTTDNSVSLTWNASTNSDIYKVNIYQWNGQTVCNTTSTGCTVTGLLPGTLYRFYLFGHNSYGDSGQNFVVGTTTGQSPIPGIPQNFKVTRITDTSVSLTWDPVSTASTYSLALNGNWGLFQPMTGTNYVVTGLVPGTYYYFNLKSTNKYGDSNGNQFTSATTTGTRTIPTSPTGIGISAKTNTTLTLSWNPVTKADTYTVKIGGSNTVLYTGSNPSFTVTGLTQNTYYWYSVTANNQYGSSDPVTVGGYTDNKTYDSTSDISDPCQQSTVQKSFSIPTTATPGTSGIFEVTITNNSNQSLYAKITSIDKQGGLFQGSMPVRLDYDMSTQVISGNTHMNIPIQWTFPTSAGAEYNGATGSITANFSLSCQ